MVAVVAVLQHIVEFRIPAAEDIQPVVVRIRTVFRTELVQLLVDTAELVVDIVMVVGIVEVLAVDMVSALEQEERVLQHQ